MSTAYPGQELELFAQAQHWKAYVGSLVRRYLLGDVLEVGAGIGATTRALCDGSPRTWLCLEPDPVLAARLTQAVANGRLPACCRVATGLVHDMPATRRFDAILYVDVLEHIEWDGVELAAAASRLKPGGTLIVLAPAHGWLYSPFDAAIGHYRRYTRRSLAEVVPPGLCTVMLRYVDSAGLLASLANRVMLRRALPRQEHILWWDRLLVPLSRRLDPWLAFRLGKSVLGVWQVPGASSAAGARPSL